ncbi:dihydrodipicolinate synthase family protein [Caballeronia grimmiae]|uniref:Dihydrodipicolinate synthase family protein n=1 Tax=Caballeronia grimmiae TaxID=1071679 RepID=A0A069NC03_9BURK|nr:dihydrodipicolinate synthase family protein [Caballeronia grimmiae]KDR25632.1 dihydrodipicolinate synthetase [Caballeronia grimmiae]GGD98078.1 dihydrodipicolinate synthase family protein [Caballeronia grimmiae]
MSDCISGVWVPVATPFDEEGSVDYDMFSAHAHWLLSEGVDGLAILGTTSEANSLSVDERLSAMRTLIDMGVEPARLLPGTGSCSITDAVRMTTAAVDAGCPGVLVLPPFYYKGLSDDALFTFYSELIEKVNRDALRIYLYHIPQFSQVGFSIELVRRLVHAFPNVIAGLKDSSGDISNTLAMLEAFPSMHIFPGSEAFLLECLRAGAAGCITASGNANPRAICDLYASWREDTADAKQETVTRFRKIVEQFPLIPGVKALVARRAANASWRHMRTPLQALTGEQEARLADALRASGF